MNSELPSTLQLVDAPELATLHVLEAALATLERALIAAYPELEDGLCLQRPCPLSTEAWLADAIIVHITGLETALFHYRFQLRARGLLRPPSF
jgi:hypothetical protein